MHLFDLPLEILLAILEELTLTKTLSCQRVSRRFRDIITDSVSIQYTIEKTIACVQDNPKCELPIADRLQKLRQIERSWACLEYNFKKTLHVPQLSSGTYDVAAGLYFLGLSSTTDRFTTLGVQSVRLPSAVDEPVEWRTNTVDDRTILNFGTAEEEHDLLALVTCPNRAGGSLTKSLEIVLLRYSTGTFHECADSPVIHVSSNMLSEIPSINIQIVGENLVIIVMYLREQTALHNFIRVYDWKKGVQKCEPYQGYNRGLVFLREDIFLSPNVENATLEVYQITPSSFQLIQVLRLPALEPERVIGSISCRAEPNPTMSEGSSHERPFSNRPEDAIIIIALEVEDLDGMVIRSFSMIVHRRSLLARIPDTTRPLTVRPTRWEKWGPPITRWFDVDHFSSPLITATFGQRYVQLIFPQDGGSSIVLLDFNQNRVRRAKARGLEDERISIVGGKGHNICKTWGTFAEDITCELPFLACQSDEEWNYGAVSIDEQRIIGAHSGSDNFFTDALEVIHFG